MASPDFQHLRVNKVKDVAVVDILTGNLQGPRLAQELGEELGLIAAQDWARKLVVNFSRVDFMSSTGFAILFKLAMQAASEGRAMRFCEMKQVVRLGAEMVGLPKVAGFDETEAQALATLSAV